MIWLELTQIAAPLILSGWQMLLAARSGLRFMGTAISALPPTSKP